MSLKKAYENFFKMGTSVSRYDMKSGKAMEELCNVQRDKMPAWFEGGMDFAMRAPTAINQQRFYITLVSDNTVRAEARLGPCSKIDLGIVKYHFEIGAGKESFKWEK